MNIEERIRQAIWAELERQEEIDGCNPSVSRWEPRDDDDGDGLIDGGVNMTAVASAVVSELGLEPTYVTGWMGASGIVRVTPPMMGEAWPDEPAKRYVRWGTKWEPAE